MNCEKCGNKMDFIQKGRTIHWRCSKCQWEIMTSFFEPIEMDQKLPDGWTYSGSPDGRFVHIKAGNGNDRIRIDPQIKSLSTHICTFWTEVEICRILMELLLHPIVLMGIYRGNKENIYAKIRKKNNRTWSYRYRN